MVECSFTNYVVVGSSPVAVIENVREGVKIVEMKAFLGTLF